MVLGAEGENPLLGAAFFLVASRPAKSRVEFPVIERLPQTRPPSPASSLQTEMYRAMERVAGTVYSGATVIPSMSTGASDQAQLRAKGIQSYGIGPASTESDELDYPAHGDVERLAESSLYPFVEYVWNVVTAVAGHP